MRIGEIAQLAGVSARSIRHYHRLGVLAEPPRTTGGYREYDVSDLARVARIAFLSGSGVPLREIGAMLDSGGGTDRGDDGGADASPSRGDDGGADASPSRGGPARDLAAIRAGIEEQISALTRQRDRLDVIAQRTADGLPLGLLPEAVSRALNICRTDASGDPELAALLNREHDMLDLVALNGVFPEALTSSYVAIGTDSDRRHQYLTMLRGFHQIDGRRPADVEEEITRLVEALLADEDLRRLVAGKPPEVGNRASDASSTFDANNDPSGPTLDQLIPDPAQREVLRRTLTALGVLQ